MSDLPHRQRYEPSRAATGGYQPAGLADVLDRVLDKGVVIAGDISISLAQVELLTIKVRLLLASVDRAREMGIDWWTRDPALSSVAADTAGGDGREDSDGRDEQELSQENRALRERVAQLESRLGGVLQQPESTASPGPTPMDVGDLVGGRGRTAARRPAAREEETGEGQPEEEGDGGQQGEGGSSEGDESQE